MEKKIVKKYIQNFENISKSLYFKVWEYAGLQIHFINITQYIKKKIILSKITGMKYLKKDVFFV